MALKLHTSYEKALRAILRAENSRVTYRNIRGLLGKDNTPLTQEDVLSIPNDSKSAHTTITTKEEVEEHILNRNRKHSLQSLATLFMTIPELSHATDPTNSDKQMELFLSGQFFDSKSPDHSHLSNTQIEWIQSLQRAVKSEISLSLMIEDFKKYFKAKQEQTALLPSGHDLGH